MQFNFDAYFFDYDGVLANTMDYNYIAWTEAFKEVGTTIDKSLYFQQEGKSRKVVAKEQLERDGLDISLTEKIALRKDEIFREKFSKEIALYPKTLELISFLKEQGKTLIVVTGASRERIETSEINQKLLPLFDYSVTADDTVKGKPYPDPYLKALDYTSFHKDQCVVIENAPMGIQAAKQAGLSCIALCHTLERDQLEKADFILNNSSELFQTILAAKEDN